MTGLALGDLRKSFDGQPVIRGLDLVVPEGQFCVVVGPSGCGKSTLLRLVAGLETPDSGRIAIGGHDVTDQPPRARRVAMVFQNYALLPHLSVARNIAFGMEIRGEDRARIADKVAETARLLRLEDHLDKKPRQLSGGQRQRVAMGRAIVRDPALFLFDEPLSNLDAQLRGEMRVEIRRLQQRLGRTALYVTHDQVEAMTMADLLVVMNGGRIEQAGQPHDLYDRPASLFVARFIGAPAMNVLPAELGRGRVRSALGDHPVRATASEGPVHLGVRPEHLRLAPGEAAPEMMVHLVEPHGADAFLHGEIGAAPVLMRVPGETRVRPGDRLPVAPIPERVHLFDADGVRLV
ncbi:ABC transporter ATP-binding protein [Rhodovulum euryhalinum]|uniref:Carbohydrate ABC transporter ATP-binding protein (CUT1 family) n=1 Tax=Rhodovulum euryhalinum TaxID=35805 RepID=A0A4R2KVC2_9RHOB|nr:sn-glycerol-3-phosphate ABC transporter ATP-binding protein UgpC [Rhodovulum euryhalinum]TCO74168.1 carbohydrate ABC transporter ATP-binding protein (CUT1 family) [Rhodovulum euryhalinum]